MSAACTFCDDTGSLSKDVGGHLDCPHCSIADERVEFERWVMANMPAVNLIQAWLIYQHGKAASSGQHQ